MSRSLLTPRKVCTTDTAALAYLDKADGWDYSVEAARAGAAHSYVYHDHPACSRTGSEGRPSWPVGGAMLWRHRFSSALTKGNSGYSANADPDLEQKPDDGGIERSPL